MSHNNHTGRWLTDFRALFDPHPLSGASELVVGSMDKSPRKIEWLTLSDKKSKSSGGAEPRGVCRLTKRLQDDEYLTAVSSLNVLHPQRNAMVSGTGSGRVLLWEA